MFRKYEFYINKFVTTWKKILLHWIKVFLKKNINNTVYQKVVNRFVTVNHGFDTETVNPDEDLLKMGAILEDFQYLKMQVDKKSNFIWCIAKKFLLFNYSETDITVDRQIKMSPQKSICNYDTIIGIILSMRKD